MNSVWSTGLGWWALGIGCAAGFVIAKRQIDADKKVAIEHWSERQQRKREEEEEKIREWEKTVSVFSFVLVKVADWSLCPAW